MKRHWRGKKNCFCWLHVRPQGYEYEEEEREARRGRTSHILEGLTQTGKNLVHSTIKWNTVWFMSKLIQPDLWRSNEICEGNRNLSINKAWKLEDLIGLRNRSADSRTRLFVMVCEGVYYLPLFMYLLSVRLSPTSYTFCNMQIIHWLWGSTLSPLNCSDQTFSSAARCQLHRNSLHSNSHETREAAKMAPAHSGSWLGDFHCETHSLV
jgi:hypothetical protein